MVLKEPHPNKNGKKEQCGYPIWKRPVASGEKTWSEKWRQRQFQVCRWKPFALGKGGEYKCMEEFDIGYPHSKVNRVIKEDARTIKNRMTAFRLDKEYYDGARENGYGGFHYDGRWAKMVPAIIERYGLTSSSAVLDVGCIWFPTMSSQDRKRQP